MNPRRRFLVFGLALAAAVPGVGPAAATSYGGSRPATMCSRNSGFAAQTPVAGGAYTVMVGEWGVRAPLCLHTDGGPDFTITASAINMPTACAFPDITVSGPRNNMPVQLSRLGSPVSTWNTVVPAHGDFNVAYDITIGPHRNSTTWNGGAEVMVWLATRGHPVPLGRVVATHVQISGSYYTAYMLPRPPRSDYWTVVTFVREKQAQSVTNLNLGRVIRLGEQFGSIPSTMYLLKVQAGVEIIKGGQGFATKYFSYHHN